MQIIVDSSESLLTIINDILDFSRLEAGKVGLEQIPFNLEQSVYDVMALLAPRCQNKTLQLILDYPPDLPRNFSGDPGRILMVAAHNYDLAHARSHGMRTAFIPRPTEYGPAQTTDLGAESDWDVVADDMIALAKALGA